MQAYLDLMKRIVQFGEERSDRTGVGTKSLFGEQLRVDLSDGFPILTTKKIWFKGVKAELLWMLSGDTNVRALKKQGVHIWDEWADKKGDLGPVYGRQWREWEDRRPDERAWIDQIATVINTIQEDPFGRRHIVSAWNVADVHKMRLPCCHVLFQFYVHANGRLSCHMYQRSADYFLGVPFNIASYALLTYMVAHVCSLAPGDLVISFGDVHLYSNHMEQVREQLGREPKMLPDLALNTTVTDIDGFTMSDFKLIDYDYHPAIEAPVAV